MEKKIKILILEDDENDIMFLVHELERSGINFESRTAGNKKNYIESLKAYSPDIILADFYLPSIDAVAAFKMKEELLPEVPFIIVSGQIGEENAVELIKTGITDYVLKDKLFSLGGKLHRALSEAKQKQDKKIAEERLQENKVKLAEAQHAAKMGNWEVNLIDRSEYWCDEVYYILGLKPNEITPSIDNFLDFIPSGKREEIRSIVSEAEKTFTNYSFTTSIIKKDGSTGYIYSRGQFIFDSKGIPVREVGILQDITETKLLEEELKATNKELETFIYRASHDLRGPLSSIIGLTNVSKSEVTDEISKKYFQMVEASALKLDATLVSLVQSMTLRDMKVEFELIDLNEIINDTLSQLKFHDGFSTVNIRVNSSLRDKIWSNKLILSSVFQNLIQNALKYQNYHGGQAYLDINLKNTSNGVEMIFKDNGIGIDENVRDRIFDMYFRGTSSSTGSGLGLYIVKIGIEKLKGNITFESEKGEGTTFIIRLPVSDKSKA
ncbi:MAG TPA: ATP-binding protein [Bacteroidia bacterium]|jgi:two-component system sensor histidine kinase UhpB